MLIDKSLLITVLIFSVAGAIATVKGIITNDIFFLLEGLLALPLCYWIFLKALK